MAEMLILAFTYDGTVRGGFLFSLPTRQLILAYISKIGFHINWSRDYVVSGQNWDQGGEPWGYGTRYRSQGGVGRLIKSLDPSSNE